MRGNLLVRNVIGIAAVALLQIGLMGHAAAQSSASDSQSLANNLVTQQSTSAASAQVAGLVGAAVSNVISPAPAPAGAPAVSHNGGQYFDSRQLGLAAGQNPKAGFWVQGAITFVDGDDTGGAFDGDVFNIIAGLDYKIKKDTVLGVSVGYEDLDLDTAFNNGTFKGEGFGVTPYFGMALGDSMSLQVLAGWTTIDYDTTRNSGAVTSSFDANRYFGSASLGGNFKLSDKFALAPKVSILQLAEVQDSFIDSAGNATAESTIDLGRVSFGGTLSYLGQKVTPYVRLLGEYDYIKEDAVELGGGNFSSDDALGLNASAGMKIDFGNGLSGTVEGTSAALLRENLDVYTVTGRLRYTW